MTNVKFTSKGPLYKLGSRGRRHTTSPFYSPYYFHQLYFPQAAEYFKVNFTSLLISTRKKKKTHSNKKETVVTVTFTVQLLWLS